MCKKVAESGGVEAIMQLVRGAGAKATAVARPACALLRQLAGSDTLKPHIISADGLVGPPPTTHLPIALLLVVELAPFSDTKPKTSIPPTS